MMTIMSSSSSLNYRMSQRRPQACQECAKRKRKCDKQIPCGRCKRLKLDCTRETVRLRNLSAKHADEVAFLESIKNDIVSSQSCDPAIVAKINDRISYLQFGSVESIGLPQRSEGSSNDLDNSSHSNTEPVGPLSSAEPTKDADASSILTALEYLAWGRSSGGCYPHRTCAHHQHRAGSLERRSLNHFASNLPSPSDARRLVHFHIDHLAWHHNCLHSTTFLDRCELFWQSGTYDHPLWLATYLSVLSSTVYCVQNSQKFTHQLGIDLSLFSSKNLFEDMLDLLYSEDFLSEVSLYSVQAIVISTEVAHNLGFSQLNAILIGAAIRIAQCLGLHKIENRDLTSMENPEHWTELVDVEVGKRVWCQMLVQDLFAIPFNDSYGIIPSHCSTDLPSNCNDDLIPRSIDTPTVSSYCRVLSQLALLMPEMAEGLGPVKQRKPLQQQYDHILKMDRKMRETVREIPPFLLREDATEESRLPWLSIARRSLAITAADKIIMIHRPFLFRAFQSPKLYSYTRRTCVAAAMTIIREHDAITKSDDLSIWTHTAFCITAAVILCFEVSYRVSTVTTAAMSSATAATTVATTSNSNDTVRDGSGNNSTNINNEDIETYRKAIQSARARLVARKNDVLASRGVTLIDVISLEEEEEREEEDQREQTTFTTSPSASTTTSSALNPPNERTLSQHSKSPKLINLSRVVENFFAINKLDSTHTHAHTRQEDSDANNNPIVPPAFAPLHLLDHPTVNPGLSTAMATMTTAIPCSNSPNLTTANTTTAGAEEVTNNDEYFVIDDDDVTMPIMSDILMHDFDDWFNTTFNEGQQQQQQQQQQSSSSSSYGGTAGSTWL